MDPIKAGGHRAYEASEQAFPARIKVFIGLHIKPKENWL
jgi:hypothetical protein